MAGKAGDAAAYRTAPLRVIAAGVTGSAGTFFGIGVIGTALFEDYIPDLVDMVLGFDVRHLAHPGGGYAVNMAFGAEAGDDGGCMALFTTEVGFRMAGMGVGPGLPSPLIGEHGYRPHPGLA